jgi:hypothetical protein
MFEELIRHPLLKKALSAGEERVGKVVAAVLSNEQIMARIQRAMTAALEARAMAEKALKGALQAVNLPTTDDVAELKQRLAELETLIDGLASRLDQGGEKTAAPPPAEGPGPQDPPTSPSR